MAKFFRKTAKDGENNKPHKEYLIFLQKKMKMKNLLILNDVSPENSIGGQASFINNLMPYLNNHYKTQLITLPKFWLKISFLPRRLLYLMFLISKTARIKKFSIIFSNTPEASYYVSLINRDSLFHVFHGNSNPVTTSKFWYGKYFRFIFNYFDRTILKNANVCFTVGENRTHAIKINQPINKEIIDNIPNSLVRRNLLFVGRLEEVKQVDKIIKSFYKYITEYDNHGDDLIICGEGVKETELKKLVSDLDISDRVKFTGKCSYGEVIKLMKHSKVLLLASLYEGFPMVIAEALCCGLPVISTNVGSIADIVVDNYNGFVLKSGYSDEEYCNSILMVVNNFNRFSKNSINSATVFDADFLVTHIFKVFFESEKKRDNSILIGQL